MSVRKSKKAEPQAYEPLRERIKTLAAVYGILQGDSIPASQVVADLERILKETQ